jgi:hypothetical protein
MLRDEWKFDYPAPALVDAARAKRDHHQARTAWWKDRKEKVLQTIRHEGLEIDEKLVLETMTPKSRDWENGTRVTVRQDLRADLSECLRKLTYHTERAASFDGWHRVLRANPASVLSLDHEDWLYFFGSEDPGA